MMYTRKRANLQNNRLPSCSSFAGSSTSEGNTKAQLRLMLPVERCRGRGEWVAGAWVLSLALRRAKWNSVLIWRLLLNTSLREPAPCSGWLERGGPSPPRHTRHCLTMASGLLALATLRLTHRKSWLVVTDLASARHHAHCPTPPLTHARSCAHTHTPYTLAHARIQKYSPHSKSNMHAVKQPVLTQRDISRDRSCHARALQACRVFAELHSSPSPTSHLQDKRSHGLRQSILYLSL